jgi:hypothetical protein
MLLRKFVTQGSTKVHYHTFAKAKKLQQLFNYGWLVMHFNPPNISGE